MTTAHPRVTYVLTLAATLLLGWGLAALRPTSLRAGGGDRHDETIITTGPAFIKYNEGSKIQVAQDALYVLDYRAGKLYGTVPAMRQFGRDTRIISAFTERDLVNDFKLDLDNGPRPHFLMTTGGMASGSGNTYGDGWAPLFVVETTTRQTAVYKIEQQMLGITSQVKFDLLEIHPYGNRPAPPR